MKRPPRKCAEYNCKTKVYESGESYCPAHRRKPFDGLKDMKRLSSTKRGYGRRWQKASKLYLRANPFCAEHLKKNKYIRATLVDHIRPHSGDPILFWDENNWQSLCSNCHAIKSLKEMKNGKG